MRKPSPLVLVLAGAALLAGAGWAWHGWTTSRAAAIVRSAVPPLPDLSDWPPDYAVQVRVADAAARRGDDPVAALRELALLYHANRQYAEAAQTERGLVRLEPHNGRWPYLLADASEKLSETDAQQKYLEKTLRVAPYYPAARIRLADLLLKLGRSGRARELYEDYLAMIPGEPHARLALARIMLDAGERNSAIAALKALARDHPSFVATHNLLSAVYASVGDARRAAEERRAGNATGEGQRIDDPWLRWMYSWSFDPFLGALAGDANAQARAIESSLPFFRRVFRRHPDDPRACDALGGLYLQLGRLDAAAAVLERGIGKTPGFAELYATLARTLQQQKNTQKAVQTLQRGMRAAPSSPLLPFALGSLLDNQGRHRDAVPYYRDAIRLNPGSAHARWSLGLCFLTLGDTADAARNLGHALDLQPRRADALYDQADRDLSAGKLAQAACCLQVLIRHSPGMPVHSMLERGATLARKAANGPAEHEFSALLALLQS